MSSVQISIIIPAYNAEKWIADTLSSVDRERWEDVETIVVDDGSMDDTVAIVAQNFPWVRLERQVNKGCSAARTRGTELAMGKYIKYLDADDLLESGVLKRQLAIAESSNADVIYGNWQRFIQTNDGQWRVSEKVERKIQDVSVDTELAFFTGMWCCTAAYLWRRSFLKETHPGWHPNLPVIQDARFAFDAASVGACFVHDLNIAASYRVVSTGSVSTRSRAAFNQDCFKNCVEIHDLWVRNGTLFEDRRQAVLSISEDLGVSAYTCDRNLAKKAIEFALSVDSTWRLKSTKLRYILSGIIGSTQTVAVVSQTHRIRQWLRRILKQLTSLKNVSCPRPDNCAFP